MENYECLASFGNAIKRQTRRACCKRGSVNLRKTPFQEMFDPLNTSFFFAWFFFAWSRKVRAQPRFKFAHGKLRAGPRKIFVPVFLDTRVFKI